MRQRGPVELPLAVHKAIIEQFSREAQEKVQAIFREMVLELRKEFEKLRQEMREDIEKEKQQKNLPKPHSHRKRNLK